MPERAFDKVTQLRANVDVRAEQVAKQDAQGFGQAEIPQTYLSSLRAIFETPKPNPMLINMMLIDTPLHSDERHPQEVLRFDPSEEDQVKNAAQRASDQVQRRADKAVSRPT